MCVITYVVGNFCHIICGQNFSASKFASVKSYTYEKKVHCISFSLIVINISTEWYKTLPKAQRTQGIQYFDSFTEIWKAVGDHARTFYVNSRSFTHIFVHYIIYYILYIHVTSLTNPCKNIEKNWAKFKTKKYWLSDWLTSQGNDRTWGR